jgi:epoxyqueuosine reductase
LQPRPGLVNPELEWLAALTVDEYRKLFRGSPVKRAKFEGLLRNVVVAMGNSADERFIPVLQRLAAEERPLIQEHAEWALKQLQKTRG